MELSQDGSDILFKFGVSRAGDSIGLQGLTIPMIMIYPVADSVLFCCRYSQEITVTNEAFEVKGKTANGNAQNTGNLDSGFEINLYEEDWINQVDLDSIFIGNTINVSLLFIGDCI